METTIPFHVGLALGDLVDMKTIQKCDNLSNNMWTRQTIQQTTAQFSFARSAKEVSDVLMIPPEYVLKVKAGVVKNAMVTECLKSIGSEDSFTVIFRISQVQERHFLPDDLIHQHSSSTAQNRNEGPMLCAVAGSASSSSHRTHLVKTVEIGKELVTILTVSCKEQGKLGELAQGFINHLKKPRCPLDDQTILALRTEARGIDGKLSSPYYNDATHTIYYCAFRELSKYPANLEGMMETLESFKKQCDGGEMYGIANKATEMICTRGQNKEGESTFQNVKSTLHSFLFGGSTLGHSEESVDSTTDKRHTSPSSSREPGDCFMVRVILQPVVGGLSGAASSQRCESTQRLCEVLYQCLDHGEKTNSLLKEFQADKRFNRYTEKIKDILKKTNNSLGVARRVVSQLDFITSPSTPPSETEMSIENLIEARTLFDDAMTKLPPGSDLDLLVIGKTGHGKSCTGNTILGREVFYTSSSSVSATLDIGVGWSSIDGRIIKVVDTPGLCDTRLLNKESINLAIRSFSKAIASCSSGFHSLLITIRFGIRMTTEEEHAIQLLKRILGPDIVKSHSVLIMTYGDDFEVQMARTKGIKSFQDWCKTQKGFLKDLLTECNYRCALFNNVTKDPEVKKKQILELVEYVDGLNLGGTRYTNELFQLAASEREKLIFQLELPQLRADTMKHVQLIVTQLNEMRDGRFDDAAIEQKLDEIEKYVTDTQESISQAVGGQADDLEQILSELLDLVHSHREAISEDTEQDVYLDAMGNEAQKVETYIVENIVDNEEVVRNNVAARVEEEINMNAGGGCFSGSSSVILANKKCITMKELQIGNRVLVRDGNGKLSYGTVYMFGHKDFDVSSEFIVLKTATQSVSVTKGHYVYCIKNDKELCVAAENIQIGDCLLVTTSSGLVPQPVMTITYERKQGMFAPFTSNGTIVVDQALMSCYIDVLSASKCHALLWPIRQLYRLSPRALAFFNGSTSRHPVPRWAAFAMKFS